MHMLPHRLLLLVALACSQLGCLHLCYLAQAAAGQDEIRFRARPIEEAVADPSLKPRIRRLLAMVTDVKAYGEQHGLDATDNYSEFTQLDRPVAAWVVLAAPPLSLNPKMWWFPIVGSVPYLGWFNQRDAERHAATLRRQGWDVHLRGAGAYSTLGWFDDPVLSTMIRPRGMGDASGLVNIGHSNLIGAFTSSCPNTERSGRLINPSTNAIDNRKELVRSIFNNCNSQFRILNISPV